MIQRQHSRLINVKLRTAAPRVAMVKTISPGYRSSLKLGNRGGGWVWAGSYAQLIREAGWLWGGGGGGNSHNYLDPKTVNKE